MLHFNYNPLIFLAIHFHLLLKRYSTVSTFYVAYVVILIFSAIT